MNDASQMPDNASATQEPSSLRQSFEKIAKAVEVATSNYNDSCKPKPFYKQPGFWSMLVFASGMFGIVVSWQQQIKLMREREIKDTIDLITKFQYSENYAITNARAIIYAQTIDCPVRDFSKYKQMEKDRISTFVNIVTNASALNIKDPRKMKIITKEIIEQISSIKGAKICSLDREKIDKRLLVLQSRLDDIINAEVSNKRKQLKDIENSFII